MNTFSFPSFRSGWRLAERRLLEVPDGGADAAGLFGPGGLRRGVDGGHAADVFQVGVLAGELAQAAAVCGHLVEDRDDILLVVGLRAAVAVPETGEEAG